MIQAEKLLGPLLRAVRNDKPIPDHWRGPLVELCALAMGDPDPMTRLRAMEILVEMRAANERRILAPGGFPTCFPSRPGPPGFFS